MELEAGQRLDHLAAGRDATERREDQTAQRIDIFEAILDVEIGTDRLGDLFQFDAGISDQNIVGDAAEHDFFIVVFVIDVADDHFDDVLVADEAVRAAILIDNECHLGAGRLHAAHQVRGEHGGRNEEDRPDDASFGDGLHEIDAGEVEVDLRLGRLFALFRTACCCGRLCHPLAAASLLGDVGEEVTDVDHAARVIERIGIDRHARTTGHIEDGHQFANGDALIDRFDIDARDHDVLDTDLAEAEDVVEHRPLFGRERLAQLGIGIQGNRQVLSQARGRRRFQNAGQASPEGW